MATIIATGNKDFNGVKTVGCLKAILDLYNKPKLQHLFKEDVADVWNEYTALELVGAFPQYLGKVSRDQGIDEDWTLKDVADTLVLYIGSCSDWKENAWILGGDSYLVLTHESKYVGTVHDVIEE